MRVFVGQHGVSSSRGFVARTLGFLSLAMLPAMAMAKSAADYYVHSLPGAPEGPLLKMHAG